VIDWDVAGNCQYCSGFSDLKAGAPEAFTVPVHLIDPSNMIVALDA
jgi:hypothetical protein